MIYSSLTDACVRRTKTSGDATALTGFQADINDGIKIIGSKRDWLELFRENTLALASTDGDTVYSLQSDVNKVYQMRITLPNTYIKGLDFWKNFDYWAYEPTKANKGTSTPNAWYFTAPLIGSTGAATYRVSFDEKPDQSYTVKYSYKVNTPTLTAATDVPFFDSNYHHILIDYALWKYAEREADPTLNPSYFEATWHNALFDLMGAHVTAQREITPIPAP